MAMKYFAKYLPVEGEIKDGDKVLVQDRWIQTCEKVHDFDGINIDWNDEIGFSTVTKGQCKKLALFLCSRDNADYKQQILTEGIQEGQEFTEVEKGYLTLL